MHDFCSVAQRKLFSFDKISIGYRSACCRRRLRLWLLFILKEQHELEKIFHIGSRSLDISLCNQYILLCILIRKNSTIFIYWGGINPNFPLLWLLSGIRLELERSSSWCLLPPQLIPVGFRTYYKRMERKLIEMDNVNSELGLPPELALFLSTELGNY
jgi:hypothetical protein